MMIRKFDIRRYEKGSVERAIDTIAEEEPLAIRVQHWRKSLQQTESLAITMRTPGADKELAVGLMLTEGVIKRRSDIEEVRCLGPEPGNEVMVELSPSVDFDEWRQRRNGFVSSSCGVCGKASAEQIEQIEQIVPAITAASWTVKPELIHELPKLLEEHQPTFNRTGGVHAAALFSLRGKLLSLFEDIGRHNALDKVLGHAVLTDSLPLHEHLIFMSSRSSFELIQKAAMAGVQVLASVGGPSSLAVDTARRFGMTLIGFVREQRFNVYSGEWRLS